MTISPSSSAPWSPMTSSSSIFYISVFAPWTESSTTSTPIVTLLLVTSSLLQVVLRWAPISNFESATLPGPNNGPLRPTTCLTKLALSRKAKQVHTMCVNPVTPLAMEARNVLATSLHPTTPSMLPPNLSPTSTLLASYLSLCCRLQI